MGGVDILIGESLDKTGLAIDSVYQRRSINDDQLPRPARTAAAAASPDRSAGSR
jgi:hypothetical protein